MRIAITLGAMMSLIFVAPPLAAAQKTAQGSVVQYSGGPEDFIVLRDGIIYPLFEGADLFAEDVLRAKESDTAIIIFNGCEFELEAGVDVELDHEFCIAAASVEFTPTLAAEAASATSTATTTASAPLVVGGVVLVASGLGGTIGSITGGDAGAAVSSATSSSATASSP